MLKVEMGVVQRARDAGCAAIIRSQVDTVHLAAWLAEHPEVYGPSNSAGAGGSGGIGGDSDDEGDAELPLPLKEQELQWKIERHKKACRALDLKYESEIGELVPRQQLREALAKAFAPLCVSLEKHLDRPTYNKLVKDLREALAEVDKATTPDAAKVAAAVSNKPLDIPRAETEEE